MVALSINVICDNTRVPHFSISFGPNWAKLTIFISTAVMLPADAIEFVTSCSTRTKIMLLSIGITCGYIDIISINGPNCPLDTTIISNALDSFWKTSTSIEVFQNEAIVPLINTVSTHILKYGSSPNFNSDETKQKQKVYNYIRSASGLQNLSESTCELIRQQIVNDSILTDK